MVDFGTVETEKSETVVFQCFKKNKTWEDRVHKERTEGRSRNIPKCRKVNDGDRDWLSEILLWLKFIKM